MKNVFVLVFSIFMLSSCQNSDNQIESNSDTSVEDSKLPILSSENAAKILELPLHCIEIEYPNKLGQVLGSDADLKSPKHLRPIFYGCFDWHSSVHGFWSIIAILKKIPELDADNNIRKRLNTLITKENVDVEIAFFKDTNNLNFERTYGWAWYFQLHSELVDFQDPDAQRWAEILAPLATIFVEKYQGYLPKLLYPIRTGTHDNTAFGLSMTLDYARKMGLKEFEGIIVENATRLFKNDQSCALSFEPSGHDFLSPCLEEAKLMGKILEKTEYEQWLKLFLPDLFKKDFSLEVARVSDRTDGHLVHLDGLNFSRATCLNAISYQIPELGLLKNIAKDHFDAAFKNITGDDYMGSHWLGSFALYALLHQ